MLSLYLEQDLLGKYLTGFLYLRYESVVLGNGLANQVSNPHVEVDITKPDVMIRKQIAVLKEMTTRLKAAHSGNDITYDGGKN